MKHTLNHRIPISRPGPRLLVLATALLARALTPAVAQVPPDNVHWNASVAPGNTVKAGGNVTLQLEGAIDDGWHVYGLKQLPDGPTALRVRLDTNDTAAAAGDATETKPTVIHDARFGVDTQFHTHTVTLSLPARVQPGVTGQRQIPVSVRFQLCSDHECQPPRTVHLSVPVEVQ